MCFKNVNVVLEKCFEVLGFDLEIMESPVVLLEVLEMIMWLVGFISKLMLARVARWYMTLRINLPSNKDFVVWVVSNCFID